MGKGQLNTAAVAVFSNILTNYAGREWAWQRFSCGR
jgi:hypothetical protein